MWVIYAILAAVFAALTSILGKLGLAEINSHLATAIRTVFVLICAVAMVFVTNSFSPLKEISGRTFTFLALSGFATGFSWLFFYKAMQMGNTTTVIAIDKLSIVITFILAALVLKETFTIKAILGCALMVAGTLLIAFA